MDQRPNDPDEIKDLNECIAEGYVITQRALGTGGTIDLTLELWEDE